MTQGDTAASMNTDAQPATVRMMEWLRQPVDGAALAVFRILFGLLVVVEISRAWSTAKARFLEPMFHFKYYGFEWIQVWPGNGLYWHLGALSVAALYVALGLLYRGAAALTFLSVTYLFLLEQSDYRDDAYLVCLVSFLLCWLPAQRTWSLDARKAPELPTTVPRWAPFSLMLLMQIVLISSGLARLNPDWLAGYPMKLWLPGVAGDVSPDAWLRQDSTALLFSYLSLAGHLLGPPLLFVRKIRGAVVLMLGLVQVGGALISGEGLYPLLTVAGLLLFLDPSWPRKLTRRWPSAVLMRRAAPGGHRGQLLWGERCSMAVLGIFLLYNVLMPLRPLLYRGDAAWTGEGRQFSWRSGVQELKGQVTFLARNPRTKQGWRVDPSEYLTPRQISAMAAQPDLVLQLAHHLAHLWRRNYGVADIQIFAQSYASLNGRPQAPLVNQLHDLARTPRNLRPADWILPLDPDFRPGTGHSP